MRTEQEIRTLLEDLKENPNPDQNQLIANDEGWFYLCAVCDALDWALGETDTKTFLSDAYLDIERLRAKAQAHNLGH